MTQSLLALDQGTTSSRALIFDKQGQIISSAQEPFPQIFPQSGWVEHDPEDIWQTTLRTARDAISKTGGSEAIAAIGITNQRETTLIWDRSTGKPIANAIVWQDRRTASACDALKAGGHEATVQAKTGLLLDPYFSASKVAWLLDNVAGARERAERGELAFGTVDCFLIWRLTGGRQHVTDETNAARTCLYNIHSGAWDEDLLTLFNVPRALVPAVKPSAADFGETDPSLFGRAIPIFAAAGDQQAASFGQTCFEPGMMKSTFGTGCFALMNTGHTAIHSDNKLLTTRACRVGSQPIFALEGSIFMAGAIAQWLRDELGLVDASPETEVVAAGLPGNDGVYLVPAFTGLGAPYWDSDARGTLFGMQRGTSAAHIVRAALESVAYQMSDLTQAFAADGISPGVLRIDGGMSENSWLMQFIADMTDLTLERPSNHETTALGVAMLAGLQAGIWNSLEELAPLPGALTRFAPKIESDERTKQLTTWKHAVDATRYYARLTAK